MPDIKSEEKSLLRKIGLLPKIIGLVIGLIITYWVTKKAGFPMMFVKMYLAFVLACFIFFILLDLPDMKPLTPSRANRNLLLTFIIGSLIYTAAGVLHPQYNPLFEIEKINQLPRKELPAGPEAIEAGFEVYQENKCQNCHKTNRGGSSDRGPDLYITQTGIFPPEWVKEQIIEPRKIIHPGFEDPKAKKAMPTYFGDDIEGLEMDLLLTFLATQYNDKEMPVMGKTGETKKWSEIPERVAYGKKVYEGEINEEINCSVCHGKDAVPIMEGAGEFKNPDYFSKKLKKPFREFSDSDIVTSILYGVEETAMGAWLEEGLTREQAWAAVAYIRDAFQKDWAKTD